VKRNKLWIHNFSSNHDQQLIPPMRSNSLVNEILELL